MDAFRMKTENRTYIIAEAGVNHNGSLELAKEMVAVAADAGADAVKFQTFKAKRLVTASAPKAEYQRAVTSESESQFEMLKKLELDLEAHQQLLDECRRKGIDFLSTPFDLESVDLLVGLGMQTFKIPSGEITNLPLLRKIGTLGKKVILSTGMADLAEIHDALDVLVKAGAILSDITVLHCNTEYPTPMEDVNLRAMTVMGEELQVPVGYSDHTIGIEVPVAAVALGAVLIEKHFTLDRSLPGPDHRASLVPEELAVMVSAVRNIEKALGDGHKRPSKSELENRDVARKSIVTSRRVKKGEWFSENNLTVKRPGTGRSPMQWDSVIGTVALRDYGADEQV
jgi:N,N'-diacetyllegionaminate synthase